MGVEDILTDNFSNAFSVGLSIFVVLSTLFSISLVTLPRQYNPYEDQPMRFVDEKGNEVKKQTRDGKPQVRWKQGKSIQIVVLGDIGRSPRMQYHALSLAKHGARIFLIGYQESEIHPDILSSPLIKIIPLVPAPSILRSSSRLLFPIIAPLKALWQAGNLYLSLSYRSLPCRWLLVQNPPSIPTLLIASLVCFLRNTDLVIDWHNFGYSILALKLGSTHPLVKISAWYEKVFAKAAAKHITVTHAMARVLKDEYGVKAEALHDRPASLFRPITDPKQRQKFLSKLPETAQYASDLSPSSKLPWRLIVSSTSWTADEDFSLLLDALVTYSTRASSDPSLPKLLAIITGKGPQKQHYLNQISQLNQQSKLNHAIILTAWLTPQDYATLLASADLGVSLHTSSSGVDLPMKVVDMFGAGLPVLGWGDFEAWPELVQEDINGKGFNSSRQLTEQLVEVFGGDGNVLKTLKEGAMRESESRWDEEWDRVGGRMFLVVD